jgi:hypothetical protein
MRSSPAPIERTTMTAAEFRASKFGRQLHRATSRGGKMVLSAGRKPTGVTVLKRIAAAAKREGHLRER